MQTVVLHVRLVTPAKSWPASHVMREATLHGVWSLSAFNKYLPEVSVVPPCCWYFFWLWCCSSSPVRWLGHIIVALEIVCVMLSGFLDRFQSNDDVLFIAKAIQQWADSQDIWACSPLATGIWFVDQCWNSFLFSRSVWSLNVAISRKGSSHLGHFLNNDQDWRCMRLYSLILKI